MKSVAGILFYLVAIIFFCNPVVSGQDIPEITAEELPGFSLDRNECFDGSSLWGYINGGADIYLEYGFEILRVEEFSFADEIVKLEMFKMDDPVSAFGIFSNKTFKCKDSGVLTAMDCLNPYQLQLLCGEYYIQLINQSGSEKAKQAMESISGVILKKINPREVQLPIVYLTDSLKFSLYDIKMVKGELGIHNKVPELEDCFIDADGYQVYYTKTTGDGKSAKYYEVVISKPEMRNKFLENIRDKDLQIVSDNGLNILVQW